MKTNQKGFAFLAVSLSLVVLIVVGYGGYRIWHAHNVPGSKTNAVKDPSRSITAQNFYTCANGGGKITGDNKPFICTLDGKSFTIPSTFSTDDIKYYGSLPASALGVIVPLAKTNFDNYRSGCVQVSSSCVFPRTTVEIVTKNFIYVTVDNYFSPTTPFFALKDGTWTNIGSTDSDGGFFLANCDNIRTYNITQDSIVDPEIGQRPTLSDC